MPERLVILDRDGVINHDSKDFVKSADEWLPLPGSIQAIAALSSAGYKVAVASNQSGLARGLFDELDLSEDVQEKIYKSNAERLFAFDDTQNLERTTE